MHSTASGARRRRGRTGLQVLTVYAGTLAAVAAIFLAWRVHVHHATFAARGFFWTGNLHQNDPSGFRMRPRQQGLAVLAHGLHDPARQIPVRTDAGGARIPMHSDPEATVRGGLLAVGCSCTFAHGVAAESSFVALAGAQLGLPAVNRGVCSYSSVTSLLQLRDAIADVRPRWVVYGFGNFHLQRSALPRADSELFQAYARGEGDSIRILPPRFDNRLVFESAPRIEALYYRPRLEGRSTPLTPARLGAVLPLAAQDLRRALSPTTWALHFERPALPETTFCRFLLSEMLRASRAQGAGFALLWFPAAFGEAPAPGLCAAADALANEPDFAFVDVSPGLFAGVPDRSEYARRWQVPRDGHPNRFMHAEMARALVAALVTGGARPAAPAR